MSNVKSNAFAAYVEKRATEKFANAIEIGREVASEFVRINSGKDLTKEAAEAVGDSYLVPLALACIANKAK